MGVWVKMKQNMPKTKDQLTSEDLQNLLIKSRLFEENEQYDTLKSIFEEKHKENDSPSKMFLQDLDDKFKKMF